MAARARDNSALVATISLDSPLSDERACKSVTCALNASTLDSAAAARRSSSASFASKLFTRSAILSDSSCALASFAMALRAFAVSICRFASKPFTRSAKLALASRARDNSAHVISSLIASSLCVQLRDDR